MTQLPVRVSLLFLQIIPNISVQKKRRGLSADHANQGYIEKGGISHSIK